MIDNEISCEQFSIFIYLFLKSPSLSAPDHPGIEPQTLALHTRGMFPLGCGSHPGSGAEILRANSENSGNKIAGNKRLIDTHHAMPLIC